MPLQTLLREGITRRLFALLGPFGLAAILVVGVAIFAFNYYQERQHELTLKRQEALNVDILRQYLPLLRRRVASLQNASSNAQMFVSGNSDAIAGANLQVRVEAFARQAGADITSSTISPGEPANGLNEVTVNVDLTATWSALIHLISKIELSHTTLVISYLNVTAAGESPEAAGDKLLNANISLTGFRS